jgi:hypothetical protein
LERISLIFVSFHMVYYDKFGSWSKRTMRLMRGPCFHRHVVGCKFDCPKTLCWMVIHHLF